MSESGFGVSFNWRAIVLILLIFFCLTPWASPPLALALGIACALAVGNPFPKQTGKATKYLLQVSVVLLGFGMNLQAVWKAGKDGILFTIATIFGTLLVGFLIGKFLAVESKTSNLISAGTAICGGSAIAAVAPVIEADDKQISVSLGTVFVLNSIALFIFPALGLYLGLSDSQFGVWSAIAIHDTSSVVGASAKFSDQALQIATTVKLARALWIAPVALLFAFFYRHKSAKIAIPYFILFFLTATVVRSYSWPVPPSIWDALVNVAKAGLTITLFLIGTGLSLETIRRVGARPFLQGVLLWIMISLVALWAVMTIL
jgi:uncharacterized integral membrane protein (TIGR00698 family)